MKLTKRHRKNRIALAMAYQYERLSGQCHRHAGPMRLLPPSNNPNRLVGYFFPWGSLYRAHTGNRLQECEDLLYEAALESEESE